MKLSAIFLLTLCLTIGACSSGNDALKKGIYQGMKNADRATDPGLGDNLPPSGNEMSYDEYQRVLKN
jgi:hypothetical protein